jgi:hypothetical protein
MFVVMRDIRGKSALEAADILTEKLEEEKDIYFSKNERFHLHGGNTRQMRLILARFTAYLEAQCGQDVHFADYVERRGKKGYDVEHIWANHPERHKDEFEHAADFHDYRNRVGGLLLLPKAFNQSYSDLPYADKLKHYRGQNLLAQTFSSDTYDHNPGLKRFLESSGLKFHAHAAFKKADIEARSELYSKLAETIWNPVLIKQDAVE